MLPAVWRRPRCRGTVAAGMKFFEDIRVGDTRRDRQLHLHRRGHQSVRGAFRSAAVPYSTKRPRRARLRPALRVGLAYRLRLDAAAASTSPARRRARSVRAASRSPQLGPSPGFRDLQWLTPVYPGDTISYATEMIGKRTIDRRPGWGLMTSRNTGVNQHGEPVIVVLQFGLRRAPAGAGRHDHGRVQRIPRICSAKNGARSASPAARTRCTTATPISSTSCCRCGRPSSASAMPSSASCAACSPAPWRACRFPPGCSRSDRGTAVVLALGTALAGLGYCVAGASAGFAMLLLALFVGGLGASTQHPLGVLAHLARICRAALAQGARRL